MNRITTLEQLKNIIEPYVTNLDSFNRITENTDFLSDLRINSANLVDIVLDVEEAFHIEIDNQSMERMLTIKAALDIIETKISEK